MFFENVVIRELQFTNKLKTTTIDLVNNVAKLNNHCG